MDWKRIWDATRKFETEVNEVLRNAMARFYTPRYWGA